jgi:hypothetical protein
MCTENYWMDIVESRDSHGWPDRPEDVHRKKQLNRRLGLAVDAPEWLVWNVISKPPSNVNRDYRRVARLKMNRVLRETIAKGADFEDMVIETRPDRLEGRSWWY